MKPSCKRKLKKIKHRTKDKFKERAKESEAGQMERAPEPTVELSG